MTVSWSAARAWRGDGVSAGSASALAASLQGSCELVEHRELRALWEFLRFSILRRGALWLLRCAAAANTSPRSCQSSRASLCSDVLVSCCPATGTQHAAKASLRPCDESRTTPRNDQSRTRPVSLVTGSVASSHLSLCEPAPSLRYRLSQCSAAAAVIFLHGKASSSADLLRCSHYTEA